MYLPEMNLHLPLIRSFQFSSISGLGKPAYRSSFSFDEEMRFPLGSSLIAFVNRRFSFLNDSLDLSDTLYA